MKTDSLYKHIVIIEFDRLAGLDLQKKIEKMNFLVFRPLSLVDGEMYLNRNLPDILIADTGVKLKKRFDNIKTILLKNGLPTILTGMGTREDLQTNYSGIRLIKAFPKPFNSREITLFVNNYFTVGEQTPSGKKPNPLSLT